LAQSSFAQEQQAQLRQVVTAMQQVGYDGQRHQQARQEVERLRPFEPRYKELEQARALLPSLEAEQGRLKEIMTERQQTQAEGRERQQALQARVKSLPTVEGQLRQSEQQFQQVDRERMAAQGQVSNVKGELSRLSVLEEEHTRKQREQRRTAEEESIFKELAEAFGKRGVQALLIEQVIPEMEREANLLLARMTDNRMHLKLDTQRQTRKGQVQETLEIGVSDELGTRSYEMFSGGEAFRIDLALRIALSRLLARRAGSALPVLFIDEGFGTQDASGRDKLVEAIIAVQDEFQKVLVITHLEELKEAFPVRIEVTKGPEGSRIAVV
jgi:exonuclease SbcC